MESNDYPDSYASSHLTFVEPSHLASVEQVEEKASDTITKEYIFHAIPRERPHFPPPQDRGDSHSHTRNSISINTESGTKVFVDVKESKSKTDGLGDGDGDYQVEACGEPESEVSRYEMYKEAFYTCSHMLGTPSPLRFPSTREEMCIYVHKIFSESRKEQDAVVDHVINEPFPLTIVNTRVKKAIGLVGSKPNGLVDPYCVVTIEKEDSIGKKEWKRFATKMPIKHEPLQERYLKPAPEKRSHQIYENIPEFIKTTIQRHRKDPKWDQRFQGLSLRPSLDKLTVEVWDHSIDDKYVAKAIRDYSEPDGGDVDLDSKLRAVHTNSQRKKGDIFLGKVTFKVSEIPCDGFDHWFPLSGTPQTKDFEAHGKLRLQIWLVHAFRHGQHFMEVVIPKVMLANFWDWVLKVEKSKYENPDDWDGSIPSAATCFLWQYALQNGISEDTHAVIRWNAYAKHDLSLPCVDFALGELKEAIPKKVSIALAAPDDECEPEPLTKGTQVNIEDDILRMVKDKIVPIIRNHLKLPVGTVHEALCSYKEAVEVLTRLDKPCILKKVAWLVESALRMCILEWHEELYEKTVQNRRSTQQHVYVGSIVTLMREVNKLLETGEAKWTPECWLTAAIPYLPIVYDELQKLVIHDVESVCWLFFEFYTDFQKKRQILLRNTETDRFFYSAFFDLYVQTYKFVRTQHRIYPESEINSPICCLDQFDRWFRPILVLWLGYALIKGSNIISKTINIDDHIQDNATAMTSSSALDTATVFCQLVNFWGMLEWPDITEGFVIINFLMDVMASYTILYAELKHVKLEKEGYYDPYGKFTISERLCTALNNIEHVKEQAEIIPSKVNHEELIKMLEKVCGKTSMVLDYEEAAKIRLEKTSLIVERHIDEILESVGRRIQKEMNSFVEESFTGLLEAGHDNLEGAVEPIIIYLEDNINTLSNALLPHIFHKVLQLLWNAMCRSIQENAGTYELRSAEEQEVFFKRLMRAIPILQNYFRGGEVTGLSTADMNTKDYDEMSDLLKYFSLSTDQLMEIYYYNKSQEHLDYRGPPKFGTLRIRLGYWNGRLGVEVLSGRDLTPHDVPLTVFRFFQKANPTSDPLVEVELKPYTIFPNERKQVTGVRWHNLNPTFEECFHWKVPIEDCVKSGAVVVLTVKDYDLLSKNAFLGEAIIPLHVIPGISSKPEPQPMNVILHEVDKTNKVLTVFKSRKWDVNAKTFYEDEIAKIVEAECH